eukprot:11713338-Karenia_brevis.AAC.1
MPASASQIFSSLPRFFGGLRVMGNAAQGDYQSDLGGSQLRLQPAWDRLNRAKTLGRRLCDYIEGARSKTKLHEAWCMTRFCVREALSYDIRVIPSDVIKPLLEEHADLM